MGTLRGYEDSLIDLNSEFASHRIRTLIPQSLCLLAQLLACLLYTSVVAEGVETKDQVLILREMACVEAQGYYLSRPTTAAGISNLMRRRKSVATA